MAFAILYGFFCGCFLSLVSAVAAKVYGVERLAGLSGLLLLFNAPGESRPSCAPAPRPSLGRRSRLADRCLRIRIPIHRLRRGCARGRRDPRRDGQQLAGRRGVLGLCPGAWGALPRVWCVASTFARRSEPSYIGVSDSRVSCVSTLQAGAAALSRILKLEERRRHFRRTFRTLGLDLHVEHAASVPYFAIQVMRAVPSRPSSILTPPWHPRMPTPSMESNLHAIDSSLHYAPLRTMHGTTDRACMHVYSVVRRADWAQRFRYHPSRRSDTLSSDTFHFPSRDIS